MILFEQIQWKNFLSTGNHYTKISFNSHSTTLIVGQNGAGKSTVLDALTFSLFGKPFRKVNKSQLINQANEKDCRVEIDFSIAETQWKVVRGIKPNLFEVYRNGNCLNQFANANDQQKWLEQNVLKMNYKSFTQIVVLGSSTFVPFMQLSASNRREVIEDLLDIKIFSSMNSLIKDKIRQIKEEGRTLELKKESLNDKVEMQKNFIKELEDQGKERIDDNKAKITTLFTESDNYVLVNNELENEVADLTKDQEKVTGATEKLREFGNIKGKISQKVATITKEHKFFTKNRVCPTCKQDIDEDFRLNKLDDAQNKARELQSGYKELEEAIKKEEEREHQFTQLSKEITKLTHGISKNNTRISGCQRQIRDLESEIQRLTEQLADRNTEHEKLESFRETLAATYEDLASKHDTVRYYDFGFNSTVPK